MLLQIQEPQSKQLQNRSLKTAIGIDLGTTYTLAAIHQDGKPRLLTSLMPSIVSYGDGKAVAGEEAVRQFSHSPNLMILSIKRLIGKATEDLTPAVRSLYNIIDGIGAQSLPRLQLGGQQITAVEITSEILKEIKKRSEAALGHSIEQAVITVPAYFNEGQRQATKDAATLAGLNSLRLLNEPTAAAVAYGLETQDEGTYAIYDLGGGTFDFSILKLTRGVFQVLSTAGHTSLGGDDFDARLLELLQSRYGFHIKDENRNKALLEAKQMKEHLSLNEEADFKWDGKHYSISRLEFETGIRDLIDETFASVKQALNDAGLGPQKLDGIVMVGGSTRVPFVIEKVRSFFGREPLTHLNPEEIVACGAAIQAHALTHGSDTLLLDVIPLSLGIELMGGIVDRIIERNTAIPTQFTKIFTTGEDGQIGIALHVVQGEREMAKDCRSLARLTLRGIPVLKAGLARVEVTFQLDADGLLTVRAREETTQIAQSVEIKPSYGLDEKELRQILMNSFDHAEEDLNQRQMIEACLQGRTLVTNTLKALQEESHFISSQQQKSIYRAVDHLESVMKIQDISLIRQGIEQLNTLTQAFADLRMSSAFGKFVKGKSVDDVIEHLHLKVDIR